MRAHSQLAQLAETARTVVRMAAREGAAQAHITLHPAELGEVEIRLRYHAGGVSADVLADSQAAAQVLQGAASELKRSLEAQGLVVHDLDVRAGEHEQQPRARAAPATAAATATRTRSTFRTRPRSTRRACRSPPAPSTSSHRGHAMTVNSTTATTPTSTTTDPGRRGRGQADARQGRLPQAARHASCSTRTR